METPQWTPSPIATLIKPVYSRKEAAAAYGITTSRLDEELHNKRIAFKKAGRQILIRREDMDAWFNTLEDM